MPFTAYHFGPALLAKAIAPKAISLRAFAATQVAIDGWVLLRMFTGIEPLHGLEHSVLGALLMSAIGVACSQIGFVRTRLGYDQRLPMRTMVWTSIWGGLSHIWLDMTSHLDMGYVHPSEVSYEATADVCLFFGAVGAFLLALRWALRRPATG